MIKDCKYCHEEFEYDNRNATIHQKYCTPECREAAKSEKYIDNVLRNTAIGTNKRGAISELLVCIDLLDRGFDVFRAIHPDSKADLVAIKESLTLRIQVKSARIYKPSGALYYGNANVTAQFADIVALVNPKKEITYIPEGIL